MDEMKAVRDLLPDRPLPAADVVARARERVLGAQSERVRGTRSTHTRRVAFRSALGLGLTGAVTAVALAVAALAPVEDTPPRDGNPPTTSGSARTVLLAAAERAESAPTSGTYWHSRSMSLGVTLPEKFGPSDDPYTLESKGVSEFWADRSGQSWRGGRRWVQPKTSSDEAAWRRDGSPSKWCKGFTDTEPPQPKCIHVAPGTASLVHMDDGTFEVSEGTELTFAQLQRLPDDPDSLRAWVVDDVKEGLGPPGSEEPSIVNHNVVAVLDNFLTGLPVPPEVRAAAFRAIADMPQVTSTGPTQDELGRAGVGIEIDIGTLGGAYVLAGDIHGFRLSEGEGEKLTETIIIDPDTSNVLAYQYFVGGEPAPFGGSLILEVGWTDEKPHEPRMP